MQHSESLGFWKFRRSEFWITTKPNVSVAGPVSVFRCGEEDTYTLWSQWLRLTLSQGLNIVRVSLPLPEDGNKSSFGNVVFQLLRIPDDGQSPRTKWFWINFSSLKYFEIFLHVSCYKYLCIVNIFHTFCTPRSHYLPRLGSPHNTERRI
jgi:hypothetical protein